MINAGNSGASRGSQPGRGHGNPSSGWHVQRLSPDELLLVAVSLRELRQRLDRVRGRLAELEAVAQSASGRTNCSTRESRSSMRSRSS